MLSLSSSSACQTTSGHHSTTAQVNSNSVECPWSRHSAELESTRRASLPDSLTSVTTSPSPQQFFFRDPSHPSTLPTLISFSTNHPCSLADFPPIFRLCPGLMVINSFASDPMLRHYFLFSRTRIFVRLDYSSVQPTTSFIKVLAVRLSLGRYPYLLHHIQTLDFFLIFLYFQCHFKFNSNFSTTRSTLLKPEWIVYIERIGPFLAKL